MQDLSKSYTVANAALQSFTSTYKKVAFGDSPYPIEINGHFVEPYNNHYYCECCNRSPTITKSIVESMFDEVQQPAFKWYVIGYYTSIDCPPN